MVVPTLANRRFGYLLLGAAWLLPHTSATAQSRPQVPEGARVALVFDAGNTFVLGDVIELDFVLSNAGTTAFTYGIGGDYRGTGFPTRYKWSAVDDTQMPLPLETLQNLGGLAGPRTLAPGAEFRERLRVQHYVRVARPGRFTLRVTHDFGWQATDERPLPVASATITITEPTQAQIEERLRVLASDDTPLRENELGAQWHQTPYRYVAHPAYLDGLEQLAASGRLKAFEGIERIQTLEGTRSLTRLLSSENIDVVHGAALFLIRRMPVRTVDGQPRAWRWWPTAEERAPYEALWLEDVRAPLLEAGRALMRSADVERVRAGAFVIESLGTPEDGALVIETLETTMRGLRDREQPDANIIDNPGAADALVAALAGLRERGYRAPRNGGIGVVMAQFLEWAEPGAQRRTGWETALEAFITQQPHLLRQAALRALPTPTAGDQWERVLLAALDDRDLGVLNDACEIAGRTGNTRFAEPLSNVIRTEDHWLVVSTASEALRQLGAHALAVDAWIERLSDEKLHTRALSFLADKLEHPPSVGASAGNATLTRDARIGLREKWRTFFADPDRIAFVQAGQPVPITEDEARDLFSGFAFWLEGNRRWPSGSDFPPRAIP